MSVSRCMVSSIGIVEWALSVHIFSILKCMVVVGHPKTGDLACRYVVVWLHTVSLYEPAIEIQQPGIVGVP